MGIVIVVLAVALVFLTFRYIRQRIEDRRNEELNQQAQKVYKKVQRSIVIAKDPIDFPDLNNVVVSFKFIGNIREYGKTPQNGDLGTLDGRHFYYYNGKWCEYACFH